MRMENGFSARLRRFSRWAQDRLDEALLVQYAQPPSRWSRRLFMRLVYGIRRIFLLLSAGMRYRIFILHAPAQADCPARTLAYIAETGRAGSPSTRYIRQLFFQDQPTRFEDRGEIPIWQVRGAAARLAREADLVVVERNSLLRWTPRSGKWATCPVSLRMVFPVFPDDTVERLEARMQRNHKNIRQVKRQGLSLRTSRATADFDYFYEHFYLPTIQARHADNLWSVGEHELMRLFARDGILLMLSDESGEVLGMDLLRQRGEVVMAVVGGVAGGNQDLYRRGIAGALYYHAFCWCLENGYRRYDAGECRPFANDGIYWHKMRWGAEPLVDPWDVGQWLFWANTPEGQSWLARQPLLPEYTRTSKELFFTESV